MPKHDKFTGQAPHDDFHKLVMLELENEKLWEKLLSFRQTLVELITGARGSLLYSSADCPACAVLQPILSKLSEFEDRS